MLARVARYEVPSDRIDEAVEAFGQASNEVEHLEGFAGGYLFVDHEDGRTMTLTLWESQAALENSERATGKLRREALVPPRAGTSSNVVRPCRSPSAYRRSIRSLGTTSSTSTTQARVGPPGRLPEIRNRSPGRGVDGTTAKRS